MPRLNAHCRGHGAVDYLVDEPVFTRFFRGEPAIAVGVGVAASKANANAARAIGIPVLMFGALLSLTIGLVSLWLLVIGLGLLLLGLPPGGEEMVRMLGFLVATIAYGAGGNNHEAGASNWYFPSEQWQEAVFTDIGGPQF